MVVLPVLPAERLAVRAVAPWAVPPWAGRPWAVVVRPATGWAAQEVAAVTPVRVAREVAAVADTPAQVAREVAVVVTLVWAAAV